ncbi:MAG: phosphoribosylformylglycinamidine synthase subunit PurS [Candidatus Hodarchaeota archaeon]
MKTYVVEIVIENKPAAKDPEGTTIQNDLMRKNAYDTVSSVRTGKLLRVKLQANSEEEAKDTVFQMCNELRIYNPVAHTYSIELKGVES